MERRGTEAPALPWWQRLEALRLEHGWTRTQLATRAGVARTTVDSWRVQRRPPLAATIKDVAERLGIDYMEALELAGIVAGSQEYEEPLTGEARDRATAAEWDRALEALGELREQGNIEHARRVLERLAAEERDNR